ncbi:MAG TPA: hypothetical protein VHO28_03005 [Ignavibacteriales bacterium]|nr:hypothetical protein [Ignavibacteriales bacterium]
MPIRRYVDINKLENAKGFLEIELEGAGLYVPRQQPLKDYFFIIKHGDYEGIQLIIDTTGVVREIPGGEYFITNNKKYMFVLQEIDGSAPFRVMDLSTMEFVFHSHKDEYGINSRYIDYYNIEFYKKNADIYARLIGDNGTKLYKYNFNKHILDGNVRQDTAKLSYIDLYYFYKNIGMCDCNENRF